MLDQARLKQLLSYNPETGEFTRLQSSNRGRWKAGEKAGCVSTGTGYVVVWVDGRLYTAHRLAWLYTHGAWPKGEIDHANAIRSDNRINNLRDATRQQNNANYTKSCRNTSGAKGVSWDKSRGKWRTQIRINGKTFLLGRFDTVTEAASAYARAAKAAHGCFARAE